MNEMKSHFENGRGILPDKTIQYGLQLVAITELAVNSFKLIQTMYMFWVDNELECDQVAQNMDEIAENTLKEIEELTNAQT